jgi:hypothetical protein
MFVRLAFAAVLLAHALIHVSFIAPPPPATAGGPSWPFSTRESWLFTRLGIGPDTGRVLALALVATTCAGFLLAALCVFGVVPGGIWAPAIVIGAVSSLGLLIACFHPWLALGVGIDLVLLWAGLGAGWSPIASGPRV